MKEHPQYPLGFIPRSKADYVQQSPKETIVMVIENGKCVWYNTHPLIGGYGIRWRCRDTAGHEEGLRWDIEDSPWEFADLKRKLN
ncbi:MAG: hypothetical protein CL484_12165 [Acidobacteria bacterium]|nr:hypothetical protein [Acidobacteriota bacterium]|tara:strand:+ start:169 stop:423 length:255 start_codon:yes stop_codon:yes gene_type:complete